MLQTREERPGNPARRTTANKPPDCYAARRHALYDWAMHIHTAEALCVNYFKSSQGTGTLAHPSVLWPV